MLLAPCVLVWSVLLHRFSAVSPANMYLAHAVALVLGGLLAGIDACCRRMLTYAHVCSRMLTYALFLGGLLAGIDAHLSSPIFTYADVC